MMKRELKPGTVLVPCPVVLVSVGDKEEQNIITISWTANMSSRPPRMGIGVVPQRHSYDLLKRIGDFVLNIPSANQIESAVLCGTKSGQTINKFEACQFTPSPSTQIISPMIAECPINIECKTWKVVEVGSHHWFIGDVRAVHINHDKLDEVGEPNMEKLSIIAYIPLVGQYWLVNQFLREW
jgi:flavin reductase (DIM6/NTAB) family NADH-FMN oxidoreductase RutF